MERIKPIAEFLAYVLIGVGGLGMVLSKLGIFSLGKNKKEECPDGDCKKQLITTTEKVGTHERQISELFKTTHEISEDVAYIRGRLAGAKVIKFDE